MLHILIVEDEEIIRSGLQYTIDWLSMDACVIGSAANGQEGLEMIKQLTPDIVLTDIRMPVLDGLEMIRQAQELGLNFIPILLTSYSDFAYAKQAINLHVFEYILKPLDELKLKEVILKASQTIKQNREVLNLKKLAQKTETDSDLKSKFVLKTVSSNPAVNKCLQCIEKDYPNHPNIESLAAELKVRLVEAVASLSSMPERCPFFNESYIPANKYHKLIVEKNYFILYQIKDSVVLVEYILDCRQDYQWLIH